jgi:hypothetical protein
MALGQEAQGLDHAQTPAPPPERHGGLGEEQPLQRARAGSRGARDRVQRLGASRILDQPFRAPTRRRSSASRGVAGAAVK